MDLVSHLRSGDRGADQMGEDNPSGRAGILDTAPAQRVDLPDHAFGGLVKGESRRRLQRGIYPALCGETGVFGCIPGSGSGGDGGGGWCDGVAVFFQ